MHTNYTMNNRGSLLPSPLQGYPVIVTQKEKGLEKAAAKLTDFHKEMKKAKMPVALLSEVHVAMELVERRKALLLAEAQ